MRHSNTDGHRGILLIALMIGILIGSLIIVAIIRAPVIGGSLANSFGPCTYFIQKQNGQSIVTAQVIVGGLIAGQQVSSTPAQDFGVFFQPFINNEVTLGHGINCLEPGEYDISSSQTCVFGTCGLLLAGHGIFFTCIGFERQSYAVGEIAPNLTPCMIKWTGSSTINCLLCWGRADGFEYNGGGLQGITIDGNSLGAGTSFVKTCVAMSNVQSFRVYDSLIANCLQYQISTNANEGGGVSDVHIERNIIGLEDVSIPAGGTNYGIGILLGANIGQSWVVENFFAAFVRGYAIFANGGVGGSENQILGNHIEGCGTSGTGLFFDGSCINDRDTYELIQNNQMLGGGHYHCIAIGGSAGDGVGDVITGNDCIGPMNGDNNSDGSCIFVSDGASNVVVNGNACTDNPGGFMKYGVYCGACGQNVSIVGNDIRGAGLVSQKQINFKNDNTEGVLGVEVWNNPGYDPVGKITNFICVAATCGSALWSPVGSSSAIVASTTYTIAFIQQYFTCAVNGATGGGVTIKDNLANTIVNAVALGTFCTATMQPFLMPNGWTVTFGAFTGGPPTAVDVGL